MKLENINVENYTPHTITIVCEDGNIAIPSTGLARCKASTVHVGSIAGIRLTSTKLGKVEGLPEPKEGTIYVVSRLVADACKDRDDLYIVNETVRDDQGRVIGCRSLARV